MLKWHEKISDLKTANWKIEYGTHDHHGMVSIKLPPKSFARTAIFMIFSMDPVDDSFSYFIFQLYNESFTGPRRVQFANEKDFRRVSSG